MEKKVLCILVSMLMCATIVAGAGNEIYDENATQSTPSVINVLNRDMWDLQFNFDMGGQTGSLYLVGVIFDGDYFYAAEFNSATIFRFDKDGNYMDSFTMPGVPNLLDFAWDGTYAYATSTTGTILYQLDMAGHSVVSQISLPQVTYNVAYDADADGGAGGFWIGQWQNHLTLVSRTGAVLDTISPVPESCFGLAWDPWTQITGYNGPFLWIFTGTSTGMDGIIKVIDLDTKAIVTGVSHNVATELGAGIAGALELTTDYEAGTATLYGSIQATADDYAFGYEISITNSPPLTPDAPDGPDDGITDVEYEFEASTEDPEGDPIEYWFDWGDGENSGWVASEKAQHAWTSAGTFDVTVKARDAIHLGESDFSPAHQITIVAGPLLEIQTIRGGLFKVKTIVKNVGATEATNVDYTITLDGGSWINLESTGTIPSIPAGEGKEIKSKLLIGFGEFYVTVTATIPEMSDTRTQHGKMLFIYAKVNPGGG